MNPALAPIHFERRDQAGLPEANVAVLGGSNLGFALVRSAHIQHGFTYDTRNGRSPVIYYGESDSVPFYHIPLHGASAGDPGTVPRPGSLLCLWTALYELGITDLLSGATAGAINPDYRVGDWVVPDDFMDFNLDRKRSIAPDVIGDEGSRVLPRCVPADDPELRALLRETVARIAGTARTHGSGVVAQAAGGRFETAAEVRMFRTLGADLVTLNVPTEMAYARQLNINFASIIGISNPAEGLGAWDWRTLTDRYPKFRAESIEIYLAAVKQIGPAPRRRIGDTLRVHPELD